MFLNCVNVNVKASKDASKNTEKIDTQTSCGNVKKVNQTLFIKHHHTMSSLFKL